MTQAAMIAAQGPEFRAAGTDLSERRRSGVSTGPLIDIAAQPDMTSMLWGADGTLRIGAFTTIATIAADSRIAAAYPGLAASAQGLATPQIRHLATLGGNLAQRSRCWYYRVDRIARRVQAIIFTASPSTLAPAWRRIPRRLPRPCWLTTPPSSPTSAAA